MSKLPTWDGVALVPVLGDPSPGDRMTTVQKIPSDRIEPPLDITPSRGGLHCGYKITEMLLKVAGRCTLESYMAPCGIGYLQDRIWSPGEKPTGLGTLRGCVIKIERNSAVGEAAKNELTALVFEYSNTDYNLRGPRKQKHEQQIILPVKQTKNMTYGGWRSTRHWMWGCLCMDLVLLLSGLGYNVWWWQIRGSPDCESRKEQQAN